MPYSAIDWLVVSKEWHELAYRTLLSDPRSVYLSQLTFLRAASCGSLRGLELHIQHAEELELFSEAPYGAALNEAIKNGHLNLVEYLIKEFYVDATHDHLTTATQYGQHRVLRYLLERIDNNDPRLSEFEIQIAVLVPLAIRQGHFKTFRFLFKKLHNSSEVRKDATYAATKYSQYKILKYLARHDDLDTSSPFMNYVFTENVEKGDIMVVQLLLKHMPTIPGDVLARAVDKKRIEMVKFLLADPAINPSFNQNEALRTAVMNSDLNLAKLLLRDPRVALCGPNRLNMLIRLAVSNNSVKMVKFILNFPEVDPAGVVEDPTITNAKKLTVNPTTFDIAVSKGSLKIIRILLADPRINSTYYTGYTIAVALRMNKIGIAEMLLYDEKTTLIDASHFDIIRKIAVKRNLLHIVTKVYELRTQHISVKSIKHKIK